MKSSQILHLVRSTSYSLERATCTLSRALERHVPKETRKTMKLEMRFTNSSASVVTGLLLLISGCCHAFNPTSFGSSTVNTRSLIVSTKNVATTRVGLKRVTTTTTSSSSTFRGSPRKQLQSTLRMGTETTALEEEKKASNSNDDITLSSKIFKAYVSTMGKATNLFPLWTLLFSAIALKSPSSFDWFTTEYFTGALAALMLSMGITLTPADFGKVLKRPNAVVVQFSLCYAVMPLLAYGLALAFGLDSALLAGMVLVGSINGGQASNLCTYIAKGNVALSVIMTTATTLGAIVMTPILCKGMLGTFVPVDAVGIARSTVDVVLAPIAVGMTLNKFAPNFVKAILPLAPLVGVFSTCLLVASAVAQVAEPILGAGLSLQVSFYRRSHSPAL
jgi:BASS family bile acid:Na+ symporter